MVKKNKRLRHPKTSAITSSSPLSSLLTEARNFTATGDSQRALLAYETLFSEHPNNIDISFELGILYYQTGNLSQAKALWVKTLKLQPDHADAQSNLAIIIWQKNGIDTAIPYFEKALENNSKHIGTMYNFAGILLQEGKCERAIHWFKETLKLQPEYADAWMYRGNAHFEYGEYELAIECYTNVAKLKPSGGARIRLAAAIPMIPESNEHILQIRANFMNQLQTLIDENIKVSDPIRENGYTNFFLAYHGLDDLPLQRKYAELYEKACPSLLYESPRINLKNNSSHKRKIRVGFISKYLKGHSIGKTSYGIIKNLDRSFFQVTVIFLGKPVDHMAKTIEAAADEVLILPNDLVHARNTLEQKELDILFYQDIGMDPFTYFLSFSRLAPVQCASFGHPVTSGIRNIDYHISTELWEPDSSTIHYSEKLAKLRYVASVAYYFKPKHPDTFKSRSYFNLPEEKNIYICPQNLFKFHPDFDLIMAEILRKDKNGIILLIEGKHMPWGKLLRDRFNKAIPDVANRIHFTERQFGEDYINLLAVADVMLDTIHFCGFNTTLEGFSVGLPVVTLPGKYMRSRHTAAFYQRIGYTECIAKNNKQYVEIAVRLGTDKSSRADAVSKIQKNLDTVWQEDEVVREFEHFFKQALDETYESS